MRRYPSKLLLFGEYLLLLGAPALAIPMAAYAGEWTWREPAPELQPEFTEILRRWAQSESLRGVEGLDAAAFARDIEQGLRFSSNIPTGYGLGSSGALCAGLYDRYAGNRFTDLWLLKEVFARMESFFHGQSSGLDPLISYLDRPLLLEDKTVSFSTGQAWSNQPWVFLLDTGIPRQTAPLVRWFFEQYETVPFRTAVDETLAPAHAAVLQAWMQADGMAFWPAIRQLSSFQLDYLKPMIPGSIQSIWKKMLIEEKMALKICGAGGGGFMLGFARELRDLVHLSKKFPVFMASENHGVEIR